MKHSSSALSKMLERYTLQSIDDYKQAIKEIVQEITLLALWRAKFFEQAAFYGGTALRILYGLNRFSEDLDFTLLQPDPFFSFEKYEKFVETELKSWGFTASVKRKEKTKKSAVDSAFVKINTLEHLFYIGLPKELHPYTHREEKITVRFEVDTDPPSYLGETKNAVLLLPLPFSVKTLTLDHLFSGKMHALIFRQWKGRVKGRDWYDLIWFVSQSIPLNLSSLEARMRQGGYWTSEKKLTKEAFLSLFLQKISAVDIELAKKDFLPFIEDPEELTIWSKEFFSEIAKKIEYL